MRFRCQADSENIKQTKGNKQTTEAEEPPTAADGEAAEKA